MDFSCFSAAAFAECQSHLARNEITENIKNMQITAEICKHKTQEKTNPPQIRSRNCKLQNAISCNKRRSPNTGAAVLAPHGAFGSAAPLRGAGRSKRIVRLLPVPVRLQKPPVATALPADPSPNLRAFASWLPQAANFVDFKQFFRRLKTHQKSTTSQNLPKPQKLRP